MRMTDGARLAAFGLGAILSVQLGSAQTCSIAGVMAGGVTPIRQSAPGPPVRCSPAQALAPELAQALGPAQALEQAPVRAQARTPSRIGRLGNC